MGLLCVLQMIHKFKKQHKTSSETEIILVIIEEQASYNCCLQVDGFSQYAENE